MVLREGACVVERFSIAQRDQGLDIFLQAECAPRRNRTETAFGKIPAAKHVPRAISSGCQELCAQQLYLGEIWGVRLIVPGLYCGELPRSRQDKAAARTTPGIHC